MEIIIPMAVGVMFATGVMLFLNSNLLRMVFGFLMLGQATNLFLFSVGGLSPGRAPLVDLPLNPEQGFAEPLSQALILTAIVIGFAAVSYLVVLSYLTATELGRDNYDEINEAEK